MKEQKLHTSIILFSMVQEESRKPPMERGYSSESSVFGWMNDIGHLCTQLRTSMWENATIPAQCSPREVYKSAIRAAACSLTIAEMYLLAGGHEGMVHVRDLELGDYYKPISAMEERPE